MTRVPTVNKESDREGRNGSKNSCPQGILEDVGPEWRHTNPGVLRVRRTPDRKNLWTEGLCTEQN